VGGRVNLCRKGRDSHLVGRIRYTPLSPIPGPSYGEEACTASPSTLWRGMEDIYKQLKELEEHHVQAVRGLEKLAKALQHVRAARAELGDLREDGNLDSTLSNLPEQLTVVEDALEEETWRTRGYITDIELNQSYLRRRLQGQEGPS
jgi:hypothetical protein